MSGAEVFKLERDSEDLKAAKLQFSFQNEKIFLNTTSIDENSCPEPPWAVLSRYSPRTKPIRIPAANFAITLAHQASRQLYTFC